MGGNDQGTLSAFDVNTGEVKWAWSGDGPGYGSPMLFEFGGTPQIVTMTQQKFIGLEAATGRLLWERRYTTEYAQNIITPVRYGDTLIVSGFHKPMVAFRVTRQKDQWRAEQVWENADVSLYMSDAVLDGETLVGFSERRSGQFFALDARSGKTLWTSEPRQGTNAAIVSAGEFWFALKDDGELIVSRWKASAFEPLRRYAVATSAPWAQRLLQIAHAGSCPSAEPVPKRGSRRVSARTAPRRVRARGLRGRPRARRSRPPAARGWRGDPRAAPPRAGLPGWPRPSPRTPRAA